MEVSADSDQLERVFLRLGHAETDEQLQNIISKFLPPVLLKLSSTQEGVRKKIQARVIGNELHIKEFKAGLSWWFHFTKLRQLSIRTRTMVSQQLPVDYEEKLATFWSYCKSETATSVGKLDGGRRALLQNTRRLRRASYATVYQWILDAWGKVTTTTIIRGFARADIIPGLTSDGIESTDTGNSDSEDMSNTGSDLLDAPIAQLLISDMEDEEFEGFMEDEAADE
ncbi:hypothetical protein TURU_010843 [Turdus rufiventris]|nr:hypothetical protein TURU_010843 [Turdus rufiventris]